MDPIIKLLHLLGNRQDDLLQRSAQMEAVLSQLQPLTQQQRQQASAQIAYLMQQLKPDWKHIRQLLEGSDLYARLQTITLDWQAFFTLPEAFDWADASQRDAMIHSKMQLIGQALADQHWTLADATALDIATLLAQIEDLILTLLHSLSEVDITDESSLLRLKQTTTEQMQPKLLALLGLFLPIPPQTQQTTRETIDQLAQISQTIQQAWQQDKQDHDPTTPPAYLTTLLTQLDPNSAAELIEIWQVLARAQNLLPRLWPQLATQLQEGDIPYAPLLEGLSALENLIAPFKQDVLQALAQRPDLLTDVKTALLTLLDEQVWTTPDIARLMQSVKTMIDVAKQCLTALPSLQPLQQILGQLSLPDSPISLVGFDDELSTEEKLSNTERMEQLWQQLEALFSLDSETERFTPSEWLGWLAETFEQCRALCRHIAIFGQPLDQLWQQRVTPEPASSDSPQADHSQQTEPLSMPWLLEQGQKLQALWHFIQENQLNVSLQTADANRTAPSLMPSEVQTGSASPSDAAATPSFGITNDGQDASDSEQGGTDSPMAQQDNRQSNQMKAQAAIAMLVSQQQDKLWNLAEEKASQMLLEPLEQILAESGLLTLLQQQQQALQTLFANADRQPANADRQPKPKPLSASLQHGLAALAPLFEAFWQALQQALSFLIDTFFELLDALFDLLLACKLPESLYTLLPEVLQQALLRQHNPNLLCVLIALPITLVQWFLNLSLVATA